MSLRYYFIIIFGLSSIFFLILMSYLLFDRMEVIMNNNIQSNFEISAKRKVYDLNQKLLSINESFKTTTSLPLFTSMRFYTLTLNDAGRRNDIRQLELYFFKLIRESNELIKVNYIDSKSLEVFSIGKNQIHSNLNRKIFDVNINKYLQLDKGEIAQVIDYDDKQIVSLSWWIPVYVSSNTKQGVMHYSINFSSFKQFVNNMFEDSHETYCIYDTNGKVVLKNSDNSCKNNDDGFLKVENVISVNNINWKIVITSNTSDAIKEVQKLREFVFFKILPMISIVAFLFIFIFSNRIITLIRNLVDYIQKTGRGQDTSDIKLDISRKDEFGVLAIEMQKSSDLISQHRRKLEEKNHDLESYSYTLAHDLRSPLRSITSFSQILEMDCAQKLNEEELGYLERIIKASKRMATLIDDILELSRLSNREIKLEETNLSNIADDVISSIKETNYHEQVEVSIQGDLIENVDPQLFKIILENLFGNAWKYSSKKEIISIEFFKYTKDGMDVYVVSDKGVGFDMQYVDKLFKPFQRLHTSEDFEGTGIGLASVKRMIQKHGGDVWIDSKVNEGTSIYFTIGNKIT